MSAQLTAEFAALDQRLAILLAHDQAAGRDRSEDPLAGLAIRPTHAARALRQRGQPGPALSDVAIPTEPGRLQSLWRTFGLTDFEAFVTVVALSVELDPRYRTTMAFLMDDANAPAPTVALAMRLWAGDGVEAAQYRSAFDPEGRLLGGGLISLGSPGSALPFRTLHGGDWLAGIALGQPALPAEIRSWVTHHESGSAETVFTTPVVFTGTDQRAVIEAALAATSVPVLCAVPTPDTPPTPGTLALLIRQARADHCGLVVDAGVVDAAPSPIQQLAALQHTDVHIVGEPRWAPSGWPRREVCAPDADARSARWIDRLCDAGLDPDPDAVAAVAFSHRLDLDDIDAAAARLIARQVPVGARVLHQVANEIARPAADQLVRPVDTSVTWDDLVLPDHILTRLQDVTASIAARPRVLQDWGFGARPGATGLNLLFAGPSGTGKTLAAAVIAGQSGHQLLACDLAQVVDKYLGETEKRLDAVLRRAEAANAVLLFDEADALFGRRADVTDARDRYANLEVAYLLQRIEAHRGITILATNLGHHLDTAFSRRLHDRIDFPQPDAALRQRMWRQMLPESAPLADDVEVAALARAVDLSGGEIRAAALSAAYLAAAEGGPIRQRHLAGAVLRELDKAGRRPDRSELPGLRLAVNE